MIGGNNNNLKTVRTLKTIKANFQFSDEPILQFLQLEDSSTI